jgi:hypothetical protein
LKAVPDLLQVLRDPVFDHLGAVPDLAEMFVAPRLGFGQICCALILQLRPEVPGSRS